MDYKERLFPHSLWNGGIQLHCCGRRLDAEKHRFGPAARENYWFIYLQKGRGQYHINKKDFVLEEGVVFVEFPGYPISYQADPDSLWTIRWLSIHSDYLDKVLQDMGITPDQPLVRPSDPAAVESVLDSLFHTIETDYIRDELTCMGLVYQFLALLASPEQQFYIKQNAADRAVHFMKHHYDQKISMEDVAAHVNLEQGYFSKQFRRRMGISPQKWLTLYRLKKAENLLLKTDLTIGEISHSVGYENALYFSRLFHQTYGCSPSDYRLNPPVLPNEPVKPNRQETENGLLQV